MLGFRVDLTTSISFSLVRLEVGPAPYCTEDHILSKRTRFWILTFNAIPSQRQLMPFQLDRNYRGLLFQQNSSPDAEFFDAICLPDHYWVNSLSNSNFLPHRCSQDDPIPEGKSSPPCANPPACPCPLGSAVGSSIQPLAQSQQQDAPRLGCAVKPPPEGVRVIRSQCSEQLTH